MIFLNKDCPGATRKNDKVAVSTPDHVHHFRLMFRLARQAALEYNRFEVITSNASNLQSDRLVLVLSFANRSQEFANQLEAFVVLGRLGEHGAFARSLA